PHLPDPDSFPTRRSSDLPFGQVTYLLGQRDLARLIAHKRRKRLLDSFLQPRESFLIGELPPLNIDARATNYELDYEHRFSPSRLDRKSTRLNSSHLVISY